MARFYSNENIPRQVVDALRRLGHDVLTSVEADNANASIPDAEVLEFAATKQRILLTYNRVHFLRLHQHRTGDHAGIVLCTVDSNFVRQAQRIHTAVADETSYTNCLLRVYRPD